MSNIEIPECSICLMELKTNLTVLNDCGHIFHQDCVTDLCECPICRCDIYDKIKIQGYELLEQDSQKLKQIQNDNIIYIQQLTEQKQQLSEQLNTKIYELDSKNKKIINLKSQINTQQQTMEKEKIELQNQQQQKQNQILELKRQNREQQDSQYEIMEQLMKKDNELDTYKQLHKESQDNCKQLIQKINEKKENYQQLKTKYDQLKNKFNKISEISKPSSSPKKSDKKSEIQTKKPVKINDNRQIISKNKIKTPSLDNDIKNNKKIVISKVKPAKTISTSIDYKFKENQPKSKTKNNDNGLYYSSCDYY